MSACFLITCHVCIKACSSKDALVKPANDDKKMYFNFQGKLKYMLKTVSWAAIRILFKPAQHASIVSAINIFIM